MAAYLETMQKMTAWDNTVRIKEQLEAKRKMPRAR
jgi:hypothetical protein